MTLSAIVAAAVFSSPAPAAAQTCIAPPGTAGIDQYCESIPGADGSHGPSDHTGAGGGAHSRGLPANSQRALKGAGTDGTSLLNLARGSSPSAHPGSAARHAGAAPAGSSSSAAPKSTSDNPLAAVGSAVRSGTQAGPGFVWLLVGIGLLVVGLGWLRFRRAAARG